MRLSSILLSALVALFIPFIAVLSSPLPVLRVLKRGLFAEATSITEGRELARTIGNLVGGPPEVCATVFSIFDQLAAGESDTRGSTTIGDRAVAGIRRMLGKQTLGDQGVVSIVSDLTTGTIPPQALTALRDLVSNPSKTMASLKSYKLLVDTQGALKDLVDTVNRVGGDKDVTNNVLNVTQPLLKSVEDTIDKIGNDFSVQIIDSDDVDRLVSLIDEGASEVESLRDLNRSLMSAVTEKISSVEAFMEDLSASVKAAAAIPDSARVFPPEVFNVPRTTSC